MRDRIFPYLDDLLYVMGAAFIIYLIVKGEIKKKRNGK